MQLHRRQAHEFEFYNEQSGNKVARWTQGENELLIQLCAELYERKEINIEIRKRTGWKIETIRKKRQALRLEIGEAIARNRRNLSTADSDKESESMKHCCLA